MTGVFILVVVFVLLMSICAAIYNGLVRDSQLVKEAWSGIDVQLKRRHNLIPSLIETVKGYVKHEKETLEKVTELRGKSMGAQSVGEKSMFEGQLTSMLGKVIALAEAYPDLKANQNFHEFQKQLAEIENQVQLARRYYNGAVRNFNTRITSIPGVFFAGPLGFKSQEYFEAEEESRAMPSVKF